MFSHRRQFQAEWFLSVAVSNFTTMSPASASTAVEKWAHDALNTALQPTSVIYPGTKQADIMAG